MIWDRINKIEKRETSISNWKDVFSFANGNENALDGNNGLNESTYFTCIKVISESISKCNFVIKQETDSGEVVAKEHYLYDLLKLRPNPYGNAVDVFKTYVAIAKHYGIAGLYIDRKGSKVNALYPVKITNVIVDDAGLIKSTKRNKVLYDFQSVNGEIGSCFDNDIMILRDFTLDGINEKATKNLLSKSLNTSIKSQEYLNTLFQNGLTNKMIVQLTSSIKEENEIKKTQEKFDRIYSNNNRVFTVPAGYNISALNMSLADSQFAELRFLSKKDMAGAMQVPLTKIGESSDNASSIEQDNLRFLDSLQVVFNQIEQESDWKLLTSTERKKGYKIRANVNVLLRMDAKTQSEVVSTYVKNGIYDLDYGRSILGVPLIGGEPIITFPSGQVMLDQLRKGEVSYASSKQATPTSVEETQKVGDDDAVDT